MSDPLIATINIISFPGPAEPKHDLSTFILRRKVR